MNEWFDSLVEHMRASPVFAQADGAVIIIVKEGKEAGSVLTYGLGYIPPMPEKAKVLEACAEECINMIDKTAPMVQQ